MTSSVVRRLIFVCAVLALAVPGYAQEAALSGTVTDSTGAVLPGVAIRAVHAATGNTFEAVTDQRGGFRIPARIGTYQITAELTGFTTVQRGGVQLLVGQTAVVNLQMAPSTIQESVTVVAEAPLIDTAQSNLGGNIDSRQMQELPVQGRGWTALALLAPGNRTTAMGATPVQDRDDVREFQLNVDGQQVTATLGTGAQPRYSRDSIAEFQFISNRFDATQGRSSGVQVNAVTKSGTNTPSGTFAGYFRDDAWNAADHVLDVVVPYSDQQYSSTFGGPLIRDKLHFFANYEYEHEPRSSIWNTPYPRFNIQLDGARTVKMGGLRLDYQLSSQTRLMAKGSLSKLFEPFGPGNSNHPAGTNSNRESSNDLVLQFSQVLNNRALNQVRAGFASYGINQASLVKWAQHWQASNGVTTGSPRITFTGFSIPGNANLPRYRNQNVYTLRDDFTFSYDARGRHDVKAGGEWLFHREMTRNCNRCMGVVDARGGPVPANIEDLFPVWDDASTWNLAAISPVVRRYTVGVGDFGIPYDIHKYGAWAQDDWTVSPNLTLNLGLRYDLIWNAFAQQVEFQPFMQSGRSQDANNIQPRLGFAYKLNDRTVVRGGAGKYYADILTPNLLWPLSPLSVAVIAAANDGRRDFAANPFNGPLPTFDQAVQRFCYVNNVPGCLDRDLQELAPPPEYAHLTNSWQTSIGFQHQFGNDMALEVDYAYTRSRNEKVIQDNINLTYDPATGANYPFSNRSRRPFPTFGVVGMFPYTGYSNYHGLQSAFTKRFNHRWQASATYTLAGLWNVDPPTPLSGLKEVAFNVAPDLGNEYTLAVTDQRHRLVFNGIWEVGYGFQVSGLYFYGSGERFATSYGGDVRGLAVTGTSRLRQDGTIVPRNNFVGEPVHRVDMRLQRRTRILGRLVVDGILEVFNLFDRANYGTYVTEESSRQYGQPDVNTNLAYGPRVLQLGFRLGF